MPTIAILLRPAGDIVNLRSTSSGEALEQPIARCYIDARRSTQIPRGLLLECAPP
jgi:hypothetical protein